MTNFEVSIKHSQASLKSLSRMQYDLFCKSNKIVRTVFAAVLFVAGALNVTQWWALLLIAYGSYLFSSKYAAADRTAGKIYDQLKQSGGDFPSSKYIFEENRMRVITLPNNSELDPLPYSAVAGLGEDIGNFYLFRTQYGGYMIPKSELGEKSEEFRKFIESRTGQIFRSSHSRFVGLRNWFRGRNNEPYHL